MTAKLAYEIIMALPETEKDHLFAMLEPHIKSFDLEELMEDKPMDKNEIIKYLIATVFSKNKNS